MGDASDRPLSPVVARQGFRHARAAVGRRRDRRGHARQPTARARRPAAAAGGLGHRHDPGRCYSSRHHGRGAPGALDSVVVRHGGGGDVQAGESVLSFKSFEKGREKWQGETLHGVWFDEEPPLDIYSEGLTRTNATGGITIVTFTPLLGMSDVVLLFLSAGEVERMAKG
ncbi:terminase large subunit domain-containing protein [Mesorhizobium huakuii]|uniref:terminase large subunit domain-containing protein n=1 Tax=Mesorhizobium huakuii TaxID=28104 RepID=UPI003D7BD1E8